MKTKIIIVLGAVVLVGIIAWVFLTSVPDDLSLSLEKADFNEKSTEVSHELVEVLAKAENIDSLKYNIEVNDINETFIMRFWQKELKMRIEMSVDGQEIVNLIDIEENIMYMFLPVENMATKIDIAMAGEIIENSIKEQADLLLSYNPIIVGEETIDGKECLVIEYSVDNEKTKMWVWKEYGLPIKAETLTEQGEMIKTEIKNIEIIDIPDNVFELPPGVQVTEMPDFY